jgi:hypothetical protein
MASILDIQMGGKRFVDLTSPAFRTKLVNIASRLGLDPSALATVMMFETATTMRPSIQNPYTKATGLIQFMPATARNMGTTVDALVRMSAIEQLDWVEKYFKPWAGRLRTPQDHYLAVFLPSLMGTSLSNVVARSGSDLYAQNSGFDASKKGYYTTGDVVYPITSAYSAAKSRPPVYVSGVDWETPVTYIGTAFLCGVLGAGVGLAGAWAVNTIRSGA